MIITARRFVTLVPARSLKQEVRTFHITPLRTMLIKRSVDRAQTWVGTAQYIAPELLEAKETSKRCVVPLLATLLHPDFNPVPTSGLLVALSTNLSLVASLSRVCLTF